MILSCTELILNGGNLQLLWSNWCGWWPIVNFVRKLTKSTVDGFGDLAAAFGAGFAGHPGPPGVGGQAGGHHAAGGQLVGAAGNAAGAPRNGGKNVVLQNHGGAGENDDCLICMGGPRICAAVPCGHKIWCQACAADDAWRPTFFRGVECPVCRSAVGSIVRIYD